ncbi:MAG: hypothetical protein K2F81_03875 [Ruminococcus sp.]|nr:hypothetical protein [Ruminococcus sp.]
MDIATITFSYTDGTNASYIPIDFKFTRERYTPYTTLEGHLLTARDITDINTVYLYINNKLVHCGMADFIQRKNAKGRNLITFTSRGFTLLLGQNEPVPGIISNVNLKGLVSDNVTIPYVQCQEDTKTVNYIYVKEKSTIWDAVCAYAYKAYKTYPFITGTNTVNAASGRGVENHSYFSETITYYGETLSTSGLLSQVYMADSEGKYSYTKKNGHSENRKIVKKKYYPLDRQWYSSPEDGLQSKLNYSNKGYISAELQYKGHKFENIMDRAVYQNGTFLINSERISAIEVTGNKRGIFTKVTVYRDSYA